MTRTARPSRQKRSPTPRRPLRRGARNQRQSSPSFKINVANDRRHVRISTAELRRIARMTLATEGVRAAEISVAIVDNATIHRLNRRHLNHDYATDVLSFLFDSEPVPTTSNQVDGRTGRGGRLDGEVILSAEMAVDTAQRLNSTAVEEVALYLVHGLLHLCGYDDQTVEQRRTMRTREREILLSLEPLASRRRRKGD
jgi:probable rRNA maturation factor